MNKSTLKIKRGISKDEFSKAVETISDVYEQLTEQLQSLRNQCDDLQARLNDQYANDKEIVRLQEIIDEQDSELQYGFGITKEENEIITEWIKKHNLKEHGSETVYYGAIGGGMTYIFTPTSIGTVCKIKCSCGEEFCFRELWAEKVKYCRYCAYCISGDCFYCTCKEIELKRIDRVTNCKEFVLSEMGDVETGKQYKPRSTKEKQSEYQLKLF